MKTKIATLRVAKFFGGNKKQDYNQMFCQMNVTIWVAENSQKSGVAILSNRLNEMEIRVTIYIFLKIQIGTKMQFEIPKSCQKWNLKFNDRYTNFDRCHFVW